MSADTSNIIFPEASRNICKFLGDISRSSFTISNRLRSIDEDSTYVRQTAERYDRPLVANERCGSWYIPPELKADSAYFKSTDGHYGQWSFSYRRLNTNVLDLIGKYDGCIIVDSTKRGKLAPDALSKTIPIWCAVINSLIFADDPNSSRLYTHDAVVSPTEHSQIQRRVSGYVEGARVTDLNIGQLQQKLKKPLMPILLLRSHPGYYGKSWQPSFLQTHHPVYLFTASKYCANSLDETSTGYIQGAGDDAETWVPFGFTAELYWKNHDELLSTREENLTALLTALQFDCKIEQHQRPRLIRPTHNVYVSSIDDACAMTEANFTLIVCSSNAHQELDHLKENRLLYLNCSSGKAGSRELRKELPKIEKFLNAQAVNQKILVCCKGGKDIAIGVVLVILCRFTNGQGTFCLPNHEDVIDKTIVRRKLAWIMMSMPHAKPSRETLKAANSYLMKKPLV